MIFFNKIRETYTSLSHSEPQRSINDEINAHHELMQEAIKGEVAKNVVNVGVTLIVIVSSSWLILEVIHTITKINYQTLGVGGIALGFLINKIHEMMQGQIMRMPLHKLNSVFGNKINETISAFLQK